VERIIALLIGYVIGTFQTGYFIGKLYGIDIREHGSKSAGMTNVNRTLGMNPAAVVFVVDILKAMLAFILVPVLIADGWSFSNWYIYSLYAGLGAILGHDFPFFMKFKGGKGISCTLGILLLVDWRMAVATYIVGFILVVLFRYISLASLAITLLAPVFLFLLGYNWEVVGIVAGFGALAWFLHRENIKRLWNKCENKFTLGNKSTIKTKI